MHPQISCICSSSLPPLPPLYPSRVLAGFLRSKASTPSSFASMVPWCGGLSAWPTPPCGLRYASRQALPTPPIPSTTSRAEEWRLRFGPALTILFMVHSITKPSPGTSKCSHGGRIIDPHSIIWTFGGRSAWSIAHFTGRRTICIIQHVFPGCICTRNTGGDTGKGARIGMVRILCNIRDRSTVDDLYMICIKKS